MVPIFGRGGQRDLGLDRIVDYYLFMISVEATRCTSGGYKYVI